MSTPRDEARRHWYALAGPECTPSAETMEWLRGVALRMIEADTLKAADRREEVFEASGLKGDAEDGWLGAIMVALRQYERLRVDSSARVIGTTPDITPEEIQRVRKLAKDGTAVEFVADRLEWDLAHGLAPDSHKRRITRALEGLADKEALAWARALLNLK